MSIVVNGTHPKSILSKRGIYSPSLYKRKGKGMSSKSQTKVCPYREIVFLLNPLFLQPYFLLNFATASI